MTVPTALTRAVIAIVTAACVSACVSPAAAPPTASASSSPTPTPSATASPSPSPSPTAAASTYTNPVLGYRIELPSPWRRSSCLSTEDQTQLPAGDGFVRVAEQDERGSDTGYLFDVVQVRAERNPDRLTPEQWQASGIMPGSSMQGQTTEPATVDGRSALLVRPGPGLSLAYLVPVGDRMFVIGYEDPHNDTSNAATMDRIVRSFHPLTDRERASAPLPTAVPARSAETVADTIAEGFARLDADLLATVMAPCMAAALEQAGGTFTPRSEFVSELRDLFAAGLRVAVERRPIASDATGTFVRASWAAVVVQQRDLYLRRNGNVWSWYLTLTRQPVR